jgi:hypothetical protein
MEGLPGIHQRFIPKKHFVCSRESTKRFLHFFPGNCAEKTAYFKLTHLPSLQWKLDAILKPPDWSPRLGENIENLAKIWWNLDVVKTWWVHQIFTQQEQSVLHLQNSPKEVFFCFCLCFFAFYGEILVEFGEIPKPGENLVRNWWISRTWWISGAFPKNLVNSKTW